jgi:pyruvate formate lyase activating enzyme
MGRIVTADEVCKEVYKDTIFYQRSGGGVTLSGGEPLAQPDFTIALLKLCKDAGMHTAIDTCGHAPWETIERVLKYVDLLLYDLKHMDPLEHEQATGILNNPILDNVKRIYYGTHIPILIRIPVIPGFNDSLKNIEATAAFIMKELDSSIPVHLLPYHKLGESKAEQLEGAHTSLGIEPPSEEHLQKLKEVLESFGLKVNIGG